MIFLKNAGIFCCLAIWAVALVSCVGGKNDQHTGTESGPPEADSVAVARIDTLVMQINEGVMAQALPDKLALPVESEHDTVEYWTVEGEPRRISFKLYPEDAFIWPTFYVIDRKLIMVRYREWLNDTPPTAMEFFAYYRGDSIFYAKERAMELKENELPALLRLEDYEESKKSHKELTDYYDKYWKAINEQFYAQLIPLLLK